MYDDDEIDLSPDGPVVAVIRFLASNGVPREAFAGLRLPTFRRVEAGAERVSLFDRRARICHAREDTDWRPAIRSLDFLLRDIEGQWCVTGYELANLDVGELVEAGWEGPELDEPSPSDL
jgi:hypothetical protein